MLRARFAAREPLSACARNFPREAAVKAVSLPEKKAERIIKPMMVLIVIQNAVSISVSDVPFFARLNFTNLCSLCSLRSSRFAGQPVYLAFFDVLESGWWSNTNC